MKFYDYSRPAFYYVTIVTENREKILGNINNEIVEKSIHGEIVERCWLDLPEHYPHVRLDEFIVMPNHVHGIIEITPDSAINNDPSAVGVGLRPTRDHQPAKKRQGLPEIIRAFKSYSAMRINMMRETTGARVWQRNYFERILRNEDEIAQKQKYIKENPQNWNRDRNHQA